MSSSTIGLLSLFFAAFLYGSQNIATRFTGLTFGPFLVTALRNFVVVGMLVWFVRWQSIKKADWKWFLLRAIGNIIATTGVFVAVNKMPVGLALFTFYASMMLSSTIMGATIYKEKMTTVKWVSLVITAIGLALLNLSKSSISFNWAFLIAIAGGVGVSFWSIFSRPISKSYSLPQLVVADNFISGLGAIGVSFFLQEPWHLIQFDFRMLAIFYLGLTQVFTGQLVAKGYKIVDAQIGSVILLNDTVIGMLLAYLIFHESASATVVLGGVCIFLASIIPAFAEHRKEIQE